MTFDLDALRTFAVVVDSGSLSDAANRLGRTPSALSRRIAQLESQLGEQLFDRSAKQFRLTMSGQILMECARRVLDDVDATLNRIREHNLSQHRELVLASFDSVAYNLLPHAIHAFAKEYPDTRMRLIELSSPDVISAVARQTADLGLAIKGPVPAHLQYIPLLDEPFVLGCPAASPHAKRESVPWKDLQGETLIGFSHATPNRNIIDRNLQALNIELKWHYQVRHHASAIALLRQGLGLLILPYSMLASVQDEHTAIVRLVQPAVHRTIGIVVRKDLAASGPVAAFMQQLMHIVREHLQDRRYP